LPKIIANTFSNLKKFFGTTATNKKHAVFVAFMSGFIRFGTIYLPFKWMSPYLGEHRKKTELDLLASPGQELRAWKTGNFIERVCEKMPWEAKCLVRAYILRYYLDRYKIPYVIHFGMAKGDENSDKPLLAHAWVKVGRYTVAGGDGHLPPADFVVIATYIPKSLEQQIT